MREEFPCRRIIELVEIDPDPLAPYAIAPAWRVGELLFLSGQAAIDESSAIVGAEDFDAQLAQTMANIDRVLAVGGSAQEHIVKVTIFLADTANFSKIIEARKRYFVPLYPADTIVEVKVLGLPELMVEIDVIAVVA